MSKAALVPTRRAISRGLSEMQGNSNYGSSPVSDVARKLAEDGAIESALELADFPAGSYSDGVATSAVAWLVEVGDTAAAQRILKRFVTTIAAAKDDSTRDSRSADASRIAMALGDPEEALKFASDIKSESNRVSALVNVGTGAVARSRFEVALNALERAKAAVAAGGPAYYLNSMATIAAQAGDKNAESYVAEVAKNGKLSEEVSARDTLIRELLKWKQVERASALLPAQEAALAKLPPSDRWSYRANGFVGQLATLGDTARLDKIVAAAPLPETKVSLLFSATSSFINAGRADAARVALARAVEANNAVASPTARVSNLQSIASYYASAGDVENARTILARSQEEAGKLPIPANKASYLRSAASTYAQLGDADAARAALTRSMEALNVNRPDFAGWTDYTLAMAWSSKDPDRAGKQALAIADPYWRAKATQSLVNSHLSANRTPSAISLLKSAQPSPFLDESLMKIIRTQLGKRDMDTARSLIGKIGHPLLRDYARRQAVLFQARQSGIEAALADVGTIEDKGTRAYTLVDLGWASAARSDDKQALYFSQLAFFVAAKLAEQVPDVQSKVDILAAVAHGQNALESNLGNANLAKAETLATEIADERSRLYAVRWAKPLPPAARPNPVNSEELNEWSYRARYPLDNDQYKDAEAFMQSLSTKNPTERANNLAQAAGSFGAQINEMHQKAAEFVKKREALAH
jgi:hypothetical protein